MNFLPCRLEQNGIGLIARLSDQLTFPVPASHADRYRQGLGKPLIFGLRPEHITEPRGSVRDEHCESSVIPDVIEPMGMETMVYFSVAGAEVCAPRRAEERFGTGPANAASFQRRPYAPDRSRDQSGALNRSTTGSLQTRQLKRCWMKRREFIAGLGSAAACPVVARAQQPALPVIGFLSSVGPADAPAQLAAFHAGLGEAGYFEKKNVAIEYRWAENKADRLPELARDLVQRGVVAIGAFGNAAPALAAQAATSTIPIVFRLGFDPVTAGLVASLNKPGGNITGIASLSEEISSKRFELLHQMVPGATLIAALINPASIELARISEMEKAARALSIRLLILKAGTAHEIDEAFAIMARQNAGALLAGADAFYFAQRHQLVALAASYRIPALYHEKPSRLAAS